MPPRRSTARASATPGPTPVKRSTRASSATSPENAIPRSTRGASRQPHLRDGSSKPRLPEVQVAQSYAYGSSKTPVLPTQLIARSRMNLRDMAETIDAGVDQAEQHLQNHVEEAHANLKSDARAERASRRASREPSQESETAKIKDPRSQRVAAWASSVDQPHLNGIEEEQPEAEEEDEEEEEVPQDERGDLAPDDSDDAQDRLTDPSSFPSGVFDHSYSYERGLRKPNVTVRQPQEPLVRKLRRTTSKQLGRAKRISSQTTTAVQDWSARLLGTVGKSINDLPNSPLVSIFTTLIFALLCIGGASILFCYTYSNYMCNPTSTSTVSQSLQRYCGSCTRTVNSTPPTFTLGSGDDLTKLTTAINEINNRLQHLETRVNDKVNSQQAAISNEIDNLRKQLAELTIHVANNKMTSGSGQSSSSTYGSPVMSKKVNYFAPPNGAHINPRLTSPTMEKPMSLFHRTLLRTIQSTKYLTRRPVEALKPWQDVGDCWCAAPVDPKDPEYGEDTMRLAIDIAEMIYPTEIIVENFPSRASLLPGSTPRIIELWADFGHLDSRAWESLGVRQMQGEGGSPFGPTYAKISRLEYEESSEVSHVQSFAVDANRGGGELMYAAKSFVVRVVENYGADYTCLYRVRLHGVSVHGQDEVAV